MRALASYVVQPEGLPGKVWSVDGWRWACFVFSLTLEGWLETLLIPSASKTPSEIVQFDSLVFLPLNCSSYVSIFQI